MSSLEDLPLFSAISSLPDIPTSAHDSLKNVKDESKSVIAAIRQNLEIFTQRIHWMYLSYQDLNPEKNEKELQILKAFRNTVGNSVEELEEYLTEEQEQKIEEMLLFQNVFMEKVLAVLSGVLEFEKRLNSIDSGANDRIVKIIGNLVVGLISTCFPLSLKVIEGYIILDYVKSVCSEDNILKQIEKWQGKVKHIQEQLKVIEENRKDRSEYVKLVTAIAEVEGVSPVSVAALGLNTKNLTEINRDVTKHPEYMREVRTLVNLSEEVQSTSNNISTSERIVTKIQDGMLQSLKSLPDSLKNKEDTLRNLIVTGLKEVQSHMEGAISPDKGIIAKLDLCYKAVSVVHRMTKQIDKETGSTEVSAVLVGLVKENMQGVIPRKFLESLSLPTLPPFREALRTSKVIQVHLEVAGTSASVGRFM